MSNDPASPAVVWRVTPAANPPYVLTLAASSKARKFPNRINRSLDRAFANFKQVVKDKPIRIHPVVCQLVDPAVLEKMKVRVGNTSEK